MQDRLTWVQAACAQVLRPLVRLGLSMGLKHPHLEEMLRGLLIEEARKLWLAQGVAKPNVSQLSITTGLNRKEVTSRLRAPADTLPQTELSAAAKTFTLWFQMASTDPSKRRLPVAQDGKSQSFEEVARQASRGDVHHRAVLDELVRLEMVEEAGGYAALKAEAFVPSSDLQATLAFLGDNVRDHLAAAVSNATRSGPLFLERSVFAAGIDASHCATVEQIARQRWVALHREFVDVMTDAVDQTEGLGLMRVKVGIYVFHEPHGTPAEPAQGRAASDAKPPAP